MNRQSHIVSVGGPEGSVSPTRQGTPDRVRQRAAIEAECREQAIRRAQAIIAPYLPNGRDLVQEFIDDRRAAA